MTEREEMPEDVMKMAMAAQDAAEAHCQEQKYVYGFGTGNAKMVLDHYIAKAILQARSQAYEECAKIADKQAETEELYMQGTDKEREEYKFAAKMFRFIAKSIRQHSQKGGENE